MERSRRASSPYLRPSVFGRLGGHWSRFDGLVDKDNWKTGVVAVALSVAMSMGLKKAGPDKESASAI